MGLLVAKPGFSVSVLPFSIMGYQRLHMIHTFDALHLTLRLITYSASQRSSTPHDRGVLMVSSWSMLTCLCPSDGDLWAFAGGGGSSYIHRGTWYEY